MCLPFLNCLLLAFTEQTIDIKLRRSETSQVLSIHVEVVGEDVVDGVTVSADGRLISLHCTETDRNKDKDTKV